MLFFLVYNILSVIICPSNVLIYFSQVLMLPSYRTILVYRNNSIKLHISLEWSIVRISWKFNQVLLTGSKVVLVQIWTNKFWTFQHFNRSLKIMTSYPSRNISFFGYSMNCSVGLHDSIRVLQQHKTFPVERNMRGIPTPTVSFVCWSGGIDVCNQSVQWWYRHFF